MGVGVGVAVGVVVGVVWGVVEGWRCMKWKVALSGVVVAAWEGGELQQVGRHVAAVAVTTIPVSP